MSWHGGAWAPSRRGFGFAIDYDRAIADDEARIAWAERSIARGWYRRSIPRPAGADPATGTYEIRHLWELVLYCPDVAAAAGFSSQDVANFASFADVDVWKVLPGLPADQPGRVGYERGKAVDAEIEALSGGWLLDDEDAARTELRRARASRARHRRNQEKHGRPRR